jgi:hypothetical protein
MLLISIGSFSQISLDFQSQVNGLIYFKLNDSDTKYFENDIVKIDTQNQFSLYNLDGTLYKTISLPPKQDTSTHVQGIYLISESLFDNDPSNIEYLVTYEWDSTNWYQYRQVKVIREDGVILLNEMNAWLFYYWPLVASSAYKTEDGTKLMLNYYYANMGYYLTKVFNLPGKLPNSVKEETGSINDNLILYPNPNNGSFFIYFQSKEGNASTIELYSTTGKLIGTFKSSGNLTHINNYGLSEGLYFINAQSKSNSSTTRMIIKK